MWYKASSLLMLKVTKNLKWMSFKMIHTRSWVMNKNKNKIRDIWFKLYIKKI